MSLKLQEIRHFKEKSVFLERQEGGARNIQKICNFYQAKK